MSDSVRLHRQQPTRLPRPWDSPGKNTGVGCHYLLHCVKVKSESEVAQSCPTLSDPMDCSLPGSSIHGVFQARVLEWGAIAFFELFFHKSPQLPLGKPRSLLQHLMRCSTAYPYPKPQSSTGVSAFQDWLLRLALQLALQSHEPTHILPISSFRFKLESASLIGIKRV